MTGDLVEEVDVVVGAGLARLVAARDPIAAAVLAALDG
jgi:hypothetical protein